MPVYKKIEDKIFEWWTCPFCGKIIRTVSPDRINNPACKHLRKHYGDGNVDVVSDVMLGLNKWIEETEKSENKIITETVVDIL